MRSLSLLLLTLLCGAALPSDARGAADPRTPVLTAMRDELGRSMARLRLRDYESPYFIGYAVRDYDRYQVTGKFGALQTDDHNRARQAYVEVRVGDYRFDNTSNEGLDIFSLDPPDYEPSTAAPIDDNGDALRATLWLLTDSKYKQAIGAYAKKRGRRATTLTEDEDLPSFSKEPPVKTMEPPRALTFDAESARQRVREAGARLKQYPEIFDATVEMVAERVTRYLVNSEGTDLVVERTIYSLLVTGATRAADGMLLEHEKAFYANAPDGLPDTAGVLRAVDQLASELHALREAPVIDPYTGPAILMQQAAGVFFHEAIGHRLEGERQNDEKEGRTFKGQIGHHILPDFISIVDDPTLERASGESLNGYYHYDDEGVAARPVTLIDRGVLRDYLKSRTPISGSVRSNGHGRAETVGDPMGRMANLVVRSTRRVPGDELKRRLLAEVRRQGKPFGLIIRDITGGSTNTSNYGFQAFKGQPRLVYRVDAKTGQETLVRGVEMVGTPLTSINRIIATSDKDGVFNGFCGAESGLVPVSSVAPAILMSEIELQRSQRALERPPLLPPPWQDRAKPSAENAPASESASRNNASVR
jgi:TldD protein